MKVYLASQYNRRDELRKYRDQLVTIGVEVTSRWLDETEPLDGHLTHRDASWYSHTATVDLEDVDVADIIVFFSEDPLKGVPRGGRHVEFGYAIARNKSIYTVGVKENVFHYLPNVYHFDTFEQLLEAFKRYFVLN